MDLSHSPEQIQLRDSISAALDRGGRTGADWGPVLAEQGALMVLLPEDLGGIDLGMVEASIVAIEAGRRCLDYPLSDAMLMTGAVAQTHPDAAAALLNGNAAVIASSGGTLTTRAGRVTGTLRVAHLGMADWLVVPLDDSDRVAVLAMVDIAAISNVPVDPAVATGTLHVDLPEGSVAVTDLPMAAERLALLRCADLAGAASFCFDTGIAYLKDRRQFGQPIGVNQALKHIAADGFVELENIHVAVDYAATALDRALANPDDAEARAEASQAVSVARATVPSAARRLAEESIQFHGGIGVTWDYPLNRYLRRILRLAQTMGSATTHRRALLASVIGDDSVDANADWPAQTDAAHTASPASGTSNNRTRTA